MVTPWIERLAEAIWDEAGGPPAPPRDLAPIIPLIADLFVVSLPSLTLASARTWLEERSLSLPLHADDRRLKGLIVAFRDRGVIFLEANLAADERRIILAHEFAHYLVEYAEPRARVLRRLGPQVLPVLDAERPVAPTEEWAGLLAGVSLGVHVHFLARHAGAEANVTRAERIANDLALELLAPRRLVLATAENSATSIEPLLIAKYGLPPAWASGYAGAIVASASRGRSFSERLGL